MKRLFFALALFTALTSCNNQGSENNESTTGGGDSNTGLTNPITIDTVKHPGGMSNQNVISTDTAAMNVQNSIDKAKKAGKNE